MCGINAIIDFQKNRNDNGSIIRKMNDFINHRGPDGCGEWKNDEQTVFLGHQRLSIIDLTTNGSQPMSFFGLIITFNGEIYNYIELKLELKKHGYNFKTDSDTEVILAAYSYWGPDCVSHFNGMWAFIIFDGEKNELFISRDRFGKKPLNYVIFNNNYYFSSEIKAFLAIPNFNFKLNYLKCYEFLKFGWQNHSIETMFQDVKELEPGSNMIINIENKSKKNWKYYRIEDTHQLKENDLSFREAKEQIKELIFDSIKLRLRSDVEVAVALSGGVDSSIITIVANQLLNDINGRNVKSFSSVYNNKFKEYDETKYIESMANSIKIPSYKVTPSHSDFIENLDNLIWYQDLPFISAGMYAQYKVFEKAHSEGIKVTLDGQGVDEAIGGYGIYNVLHLLQLYKNNFPSFLLESLGYLRIEGLDTLSVLYPKKNESLSFIKHKELLYCESTKVTNKLGHRQVRDACIDQINNLFLPAFLHHQDRNSMAFGIESRSPFMDYRLMEFMLNLPDTFKINRGIRKFILRESFKDEFPKIIYNRHKKMGFPTPLKVWMTENHEDYKKLLIESLETNIFSENIIDDFNKEKQKKYSNYLTFWRIIIFSKWIKKFNVQI